jgi:hypothetical protein
LPDRAPDGILHFDKQVIRVVRTRGDRQLARPVLDAGHRLDGIDDEIDHYLLQLHPISRYERQVVCKRGLQPDTVPQHFRLGQGDGPRERPR